SGDKNFRPINMKWGPAGDIYLIDWHDQHPCHQTNPDDWDYEHGRVYRIQLKGTKTKKAEDLGKKTHDELRMLISRNDPYAARTALRLLSERPEDEAPAKVRPVPPSFWLDAYVSQGHANSEAWLIGTKGEGSPIKQSHCIRMLTAHSEHHDALWKT